jgi:hypothetical protein
LEGRLHKLELLNSVECDTCKQASETSSRVLCDCEALAALRFRHLDRRFTKPGDLEEISVGCTIFRVQGCYMHEYKCCTEDQYGQSAWITTVPSLLYYILPTVRRIVAFLCLGSIYTLKVEE